MNMFTDTTPNTTVKKTHEKGGQVMEEKETQSDMFKDLLTDDGFAQVSCSLTKGVDFNSEKVTFFVSVRCDQNKATMDKAAERVFNKALEYVSEAAEALGWVQKKS